MNLNFRRIPTSGLVMAVLFLTAKSQDEVLRRFKCHKSILAKNSAVFAGIFSLNQPKDADGYKVVHLTDPAEDVKALLRMLYEPMKYELSPARYNAHS